jgi:hypothetical protein
MSNNMVYERVHDNFLKLGLTNAESILDNWLSSSLERDLPVIEILDHLLEQEVSISRESAIRTSFKRLSWTRS